MTHGIVSSFSAFGCSLSVAFPSKISVFGGKELGSPLGYRSIEPWCPPTPSVLYNEAPPLPVWAFFCTPPKSENNIVLLQMCADAGDTSYRCRGAEGSPDSFFLFYKLWKLLVFLLRCQQPPNVALIGKAARCKEGEGRKRRAMCQLVPTQVVLAGDW